MQTPKPNNQLNECYFLPSTKLTSATICINCGKEKMLHTIGAGIKCTKTIIVKKTNYQHYINSDYAPRKIQTHP